MKPAVVSASCHPPKAGAVLGFTNGCLLPMAAWVVVGRLGGFVRGTFRRRLNTNQSNGDNGPNGTSDLTRTL